MTHRFYFRQSVSPWIRTRTGTFVESHAIRYTNETDLMAGAGYSHRSNDRPTMAPVGSLSCVACTEQAAL